MLRLVCGVRLVLRFGFGMCCFCGLMLVYSVVGLVKVYWLWDMGSFFWEVGDGMIIVCVV